MNKRSVKANKCFRGIPSFSYAQFLFFFVSKLSLTKMSYTVKENELYGKLYGTMLKL